MPDVHAATSIKKQPMFASESIESLSIAYIERVENGNSSAVGFGLNRWMVERNEKFCSLCVKN